MVRPGPDVVVPLGAVAHAAGTRIAFRVDCEASCTSKAPIVLETVDLDGRRDVALLAHQEREGPLMLLTGYVNVEPEQVLSLRVVSALAQPGFRVGGIRISRLVSPVESAPIGHDLLKGGGLPLWVLGTSARRARRLTELTRGRLALSAPCP